EREQGSVFRPRFDAAGLITAVAQDADSGAVLMVAFMNQAALDATRATGLAHFYSRSRGRLWKKGETSGHVLRIAAILVDREQHALLLKPRPPGPACHSSATSCLYRKRGGEGLTRVTWYAALPPETGRLCSPSVSRPVRPNTAPPGPR